MRNLKTDNISKNLRSKNEKLKSVEDRRYGNCKRPEMTINLWVLKEKGKDMFRDVPTDDRYADFSIERIRHYRTSNWGFRAAFAYNLKETLPTLFEDQFLIEEMLPDPVAELIIGIESNPQFGYYLLIGAGGVQAEIIDDTITLLIPTNKKEIIRAIKKLKVYKLMNRFRSQRKVDLGYLASDILRIISLINQDTQTVSSVEINPLFVYEGSTCAVDAVVSYDL